MVVPEWFFINPKTDTLETSDRYGRFAFDAEKSRSYYSAYQ